MLARGLPVSGSDAKDTVTLTALRALGATVARRPRRRAPRRCRHRRGLHRDPDEQPRAGRGARRRACGCCQRAGGAGLGDGRPPRASRSAGTHGKTTTTSLLTVAIQHCGADPSFAIGGQPQRVGRQRAQRVRRRVRRRGRRERRLVPALRADRRDRHQRRGRPPRPLRHARGGRGGVRRVRRAGPTGRLPGRLRRRRRGARGSPRRRAAAASTCAPTARARTPTCGWSTSDAAAWPARSRRSPAAAGSGAVTAAAARPAQRAQRRRRAGGRARAGLPGRAACARGSTAFTGTRRRFEHKGTAGGVRVYDSYAHHPTELRGRPRRRPRRRRAGPGRRRLPAAPLQPHPLVRRPSSARRSGWPTRSS